MAIRAACKSFGEEFTDGAIKPIFMAASALHSFQAHSKVPLPAAEIAELHLPQVGHTDPIECQHAILNCRRFLFCDVEPDTSDWQSC